MKRYKEGSNRNQITFPASLDDYINQDNAVRILEVIVESMNIPTLGFKYETTAVTGRKPYNPEDMFKLYVYSYFNGIRSSRKIERECKRNIEVMWLINNLQPDQKTISEFRRNNKKAIQAAFREFSRLCCELGLVGKEIVAIDGSKFKASNSKDNYYTAKKVHDLIEYYTNSAQKYLDLLDANDASEIEPTEINERLEYVKERLKELESIEEQVSKEGSVCTVDADAKNMIVHNGGHDISYNVQISVDSANHIVVAADTTSDGMDYKQFYNMASQAKNIMGVEKLTAVADSGYYSADEFSKCLEANIRAVVTKPLRGHSTDAAYYKNNFTYDPERDVFICPQGNILTKMQRKPESKTDKDHYRNTKACKQCPVRKLCTTSDRFRKVSRRPSDVVADEVDWFTQQNKDLVFKRKSIVEHCFGIVKGVFGFSDFLTRGLESVRAESSMHFLIYNMKRMINILGEQQIRELLKV